jgi:hypothetical protein
MTFFALLTFVLTFKDSVTLKPSLYLYIYCHLILYRVLSFIDIFVSAKEIVIIYPQGTALYLGV